jgi:MoxR-like ATPase
MAYAPIFEPKRQAEERGPRRDGAVAYVYDHDPDIEIAVNVAVATNRPLLLRGDPGCGKSSLAADVAHCLGRRYFEEVITSRTQAQDLQWRFDAVRRLAAVQQNEPVGGERDARFVEPGVLWKVFEPASAALHGRALEKAREASGDGHKAEPAVVLLDEIDKAEPDVPNDLLVVLDARWFRVREIEREVRAASELAVLVVLTTNGERELPPAFVRRCVVFEMKAAPPDWMKQIAKRHVSKLKPGLTQDEAFDGLLTAILGLFDALTTDAKGQKLRPPSLAEYLDAVRACVGLSILSEQEPRWAQIVEAALWKHAPRNKGKK